MLAGHPRPINARETQTTRSARPRRPRTPRWVPRRGRSQAQASGGAQGHRPRPALAARFPVHVTLKIVAEAPNLRRATCFKVVRAAFVCGKEHAGFRLAHFTVQGNHIHLICEAKNRETLTAGMQGLAIRIARNLNASMDRKGKLFAERYHARILRSPTEVRRALVYVLNNSRRHAPRDVTFARGWIDPLSSAPWFDGWGATVMTPPCPEPDCPVVPSTIWLLTTGWRLLGLIAPDEVPRGS